MASTLLICTDAADLAARAAKRIIDCARDSAAARGRFTVALAGGSTPELTYGLLAERGRVEDDLWSSIFVFFGDERFVPDSDPRSNCGMARRSLLSKVPIPESHVFPVPTERPTAGDAAAAYSELLLSVVGPSEGPPRIDLILLGLGEDGHTASLFPGFPALEVHDAWVVASPPGVLPPPVDRITLTYPAINAARSGLFLVSGKAKAHSVRAILEDGATRHEFPAAGVRPERLTWLVDRDAASLLSSDLLKRVETH